MLPGIGCLKSLLTQIVVISRTGTVVGMQTIVALIGLEAAFRYMHADDGIRRDPQRLQAFDIRRHVGLADQHVAHADLLQVIAERGLTDPQRPAVPVRAVRAHVAAGIERHPRRAADRRLHIGLGEPYAALRHRVDVRRFQRRVSGTAEIIIAKLIAHDPENVLLRHALATIERLRTEGCCNIEAPIANRRAALAQPCGVAGAHGSACAPPLAFSETGASPITSTSARSASGTPSPLTAEISNGVFFAARFSRSFCFFNSSGVTASLLFNATSSIFSARCPS